MGSAATAATDSEIEWFIKMRKLDVEEAKPRLERYLQWRDSGFRNLSRMDPIILDEASTGKAYLRDQPDVVCSCCHACFICAHKSDCSDSQI